MIAHRNTPPHDSSAAARASEGASPSLREGSVFSSGSGGPELADSTLVHEPNSTLIETFYGFVQDKCDAYILVEACVQGLLDPIINLPLIVSGLSIRSGSVIIFPERKDQVQQSRWRDGGQWSASRISGAFLLYREIESIGKGISKHQRHGQEAGSMFGTKLRPNTRFPNGLTLNRPDTNERTDSEMFSTTSLRQNTRLINNGMAKRTISLTGSDGNRYRVISYFYPSDVEHLYKKQDPIGGRTPETLNTPSQMPEFEHLLHQFSKSGSRRRVLAPQRPVATQEASSSQIQQKLHLQQSQETALALMSLFGTPSPTTAPTPARMTTPPPFQQPPIVQSRYHSTPVILSSGAFTRNQQTLPISAVLPPLTPPQLLPRSHSQNCSCGCSKLEIRKHFSYLSQFPEWASHPVILAPLRQ
ncbi:Gti1/Pac2 family-domain-containing protein [Obelidium mucronatum]|nr:Gti1/Pac2 family-domain-containing protein [Obelidium mucronatum]